MSNELSETRLSNHFKKRNTLFVARIRAPDAEQNKKIGSTERKQNKGLTGSFQYSCFANMKSNLIYLTQHQLSGKMLSSNKLMKDDVNNKFLFKDGEIFAFDRVYDESVIQKEFYEQTLKDIIPFLLNGQNAFVATIGAHKSGKSFTLWGEDKAVGVVPQFVRDLLLETENYENLDIKIKCFALLNSKYIDLLSGDMIEPQADSEPIFTELKIEDLNKFVDSFTQAVNCIFSLENPTNAARRAAMCMQINLSIEKPGGKSEVVSTVNFLELPDISYYSSEIFSPTEMQELEVLFDSVFDQFGMRFAKDSKKKNPQEVHSIISNLFPQKQKNDKLLIISNLSPSIKHFQKNEQTLKWTTELRNLLLMKEESKVLSFAESETGQASNRERNEKQKINKVQKKKTKPPSSQSIKSSRMNSPGGLEVLSAGKHIIASYSQSPKQLDKQIEDHQNQLKELETEILNRKHSPRYTAEQLDKILILQDQLKILKKNQRDIDFNEEILNPRYLSAFKVSSNYQSSSELSKTGGKHKCINSLTSAGPLHH